MSTSTTNLSLADVRLIQRSVGQSAARQEQLLQQLQEEQQQQLLQQAMYGTLRSVRRPLRGASHSIDEREEDQEEALLQQSLEKGAGGRHDANSSSEDDDEEEEEEDDDDDDDSSESESGDSDDSDCSDIDGVDGDDLRRAGEYGRALLGLLEKESQRARILSELLDREQKLNDELMEKQADISRLRRRATYQQSHLEHLEDQAQELERNLKAQRDQAYEEKRRRRALERETQKLRAVMERNMAPAPEPRSDEDVLVCEEVSRASLGRVRLSPDLEPDATPLQRSNNQFESPQMCKQRSVLGSAGGDWSPAEHKLRSSVAEAAAFVGRQMVEMSASSSHRVRPAASASEAPSPDEYEEIRQMYEEERERRLELQKEVEALVEDCELRRQGPTGGGPHGTGTRDARALGAQRNGPGKEGDSKFSVAVDLAVRSLCHELGYQQNRRATIAKCEMFSKPRWQAPALPVQLERAPDDSKLHVSDLIAEESPDRSCASRSVLRGSTSEAGADADLFDMSSFSCESARELRVDTAGAPPQLETASLTAGSPGPAPARQRQISVFTINSPDEEFTTYVVQVSKRAVSGWRMVYTRYRHFDKIHRWIQQHHEGGLLSAEPLRVPKPRRFSFSSSLRSKHVRERRVWLEQMLIAVLFQQPTLLDPLLDFVGIFGTRHES